MTSLFDLFKIGIGPSSLHTTGPMRAARRFVKELASDGLLSETDAVTVDVYGSLALTGKGHGTDRAILLGLMGEVPDEIDPTTIEAKLTEIRENRFVLLLGKQPIVFDQEHDLSFRKNEVLPGHSNGMRFVAYDWGKRTLACKFFYSLSGGFILADGEESEQARHVGTEFPYPFKSAADLMQLGREHSKPIWQLILENEKVLRSENEIFTGISRIWRAMKDCSQRGLKTEGILTGGLNVRRRAPELYQALSKRDTANPLVVLDWIKLFAIAVNEENAAGGLVVAAPRNGGAGVVPAVAQYYLTFVDGGDEHGIFRYFLTAAAIGVLYEENASISGAEMGCQGEVGVACSMAAGGLVAASGGSNEQVAHAAEIAMEYNLGMTCDPVGGLVQIPCIERNASGAVVAVNAARMSMKGSGEHKVSLDKVIRMMSEIGQKMQARYKETPRAGLAVNIVEC